MIPPGNEGDICMAESEGILSALTQAQKEAVAAGLAYNEFIRTIVVRSMEKYE